MNGVAELSGHLGRSDGNKGDWVTDSEVPDPKPLPRVTGYNVLIRPLVPGNKLKMKSGIEFIMPDSVVEDVQYLTNVGQVKALGPMCYMDYQGANGNPHGKYKTAWCKVGDYVVWGKNQGVKLLIKGVAFVLLQDELVLMVLDNPGDVNPMFNAFKI